VGPNNLLITNKHCITSQSDALNTDFEFMGEEGTCSSTVGDCWMCKRGTVYDGKALLVNNEYLDFALVELEGNPVDEYG
jgi:V8-like Glu-specific endopeptidase